MVPNENVVLAIVVSAVTPALRHVGAIGYEIAVFAHFRHHSLE